jgi:L,D-peptidoglycan transpeptidase YkuD (ErfK/YbiS/YcfS/YnhG family)
MLLFLALLTSTAGPCRPAETAVVVLTAGHRLYLCDGGRPVAQHRVALGAGGVGKRRAGDRKTPVGLYRLGSPRASSYFRTFVPVGYPTPAQAALGFTGSAIGIHGPARWMPDGALRNWTAGCIALGRDADIEGVADWIRRRRVGSVRIE